MTGRADDKVLLHQGITEQILGACFDVSKELGAGFLESVYQKALLVALQQRGLQVVSQAPLEVTFRGQCVGTFFADVLVESVVIVELKAVDALLPEHQTQVINYLRATGIPVGLLVNFGRPRIQYRRLYWDDRACAPRISYTNT
jgi:GxxExxY protein